MFRSLLFAITFVAAMSVAHAGDSVVPTDVAGCSIPMPSGTELSETVDDTFENGNLTYESDVAQVNLVWYPGANAELTGETLGLYLDALSTTGAWFGSSTAWIDVGKHKGAVVPIKIGGSEQPQTGSLLMWADPDSGRYFMYIATPRMKGDSQAISDADLAAMIESIAAGATCEGAGKVATPIAVFDPLPPGWWADDADLPRMTYGRRDGRQSSVLWSAPLPDSKYDCLEPAAPLLERYLQARSLTADGDSKVVVDDADGAADGLYLCRVVVQVDGLSESEGDVVSFSQWRCPTDDGRIVSAIDAAAGDLGESLNDLVSGVKCLADVPAAQVQLPDIGAEDDGAEKTQWTPTRPPVDEDSGKKKKKKKK